MNTQAKIHAQQTHHDFSVVGEPWTTRGVSTVRTVLFLERCHASVHWKMSHNGQDNGDRSLDLSEDEKLAQMERDVEATRQRLAHQERAIELMRKDLKVRTLKQARPREGERRKREQADQKATGRDAYYGNWDGEAELKDEEWSDNEHAAKRIAKEEERDDRGKGILQQQ